MAREMTPEDREQFEENRHDLIENAHLGYGVTLTAHADDSITVTGTLNAIVDFYGDFRSEIEEML